MRKNKLRKKSLTGWTIENWKLWIDIPENQPKVWNEIQHPRIFQIAKGVIMDKPIKVRITLEEI